ncbi:hypothetical protein [Aquamicrobium soli]|uniref:Uncharacterized protein n=1 Tax=Aquamicrobium soli TaxID=1811518 RepID=A0ABV7K4H2_9HYPH
MNVANLQLEGLLVAVAEINRLLVSKGLVSVDELDLTLRKAEASLTSEDKSVELPPANRDAVAFPVRFLQLANSLGIDENLSEFTKIAKLVGKTKEPYNDQR